MRDIRRLHEITIRVRRVLGDVGDVGGRPSGRWPWGRWGVARRARAAGVAEAGASWSTRARTLLRDDAVLVAAGLGASATAAGLPGVRALALGAARHYGGALRGHRQRGLWPALHRRQRLLHRLLAYLCTKEKETP